MKPNLAAPPALVCPSRLDRSQLQREVIAMYERVAQRPASGFHFHVGAGYAVQQLGYDAGELDALPPRVTERFAGVGRPFAAGRPTPGSVVLDHACGAGTDLLLAARAVGPEGRAIGLDLTPAMRDVALQGAHDAGLIDRVQLLAGSFDRIPLPDASVDMVVSNGVLNLATDKLQVLREAWRVLRPGGALRLADVVLSRPLHEDARANATLWAACVGGALTEHTLVDALRGAGFSSVQIAERHLPFAGTALPLKLRLGEGLTVSSVSLGARKPG